MSDDPDPGGGGNQFSSLSVEPVNNSASTMTHSQGRDSEDTKIGSPRIRNFADAVNIGNDLSSSNVKMRSFAEILEDE